MSDTRRAYRHSMIAVFFWFAGKSLRQRPAALNLGVAQSGCVFFAFFFPNKYLYETLFLN